MALNIVDNTKTFSTDGMNDNGTYKNAKGGTEMMADKIQKLIDDLGLSNDVNVIHSRVRELDDSKSNILLLHDTWNDPESKHLIKESSRARFSKLVFVSNYQLQTYNMGLGVPYKDSIVMRNAIEPIVYTEQDKQSENAIEPIVYTEQDKQSEQIRLIYHTTPHRGLNIAVAAIDELSKTYGDKIHFDVYSSFEAYGWKERDKPYEDLFATIDKHPNMTYHGYRDNEIIREALKKSHIFAFPSIWPETSCIAMMEAMSAGLDIVHSNLAALPETSMGLTRMYQFNEDINAHANIFAGHLKMSIDSIYDPAIRQGLRISKHIGDRMYNWNVRKYEWESLLTIMSGDKR